MSNLSLNESINYNKSVSVSVQEIPSLDQLLNLLGFTEWQIITSTFVLPSLSFLGMILCALSGWIFYQKKFKDPVFFYYRLLCLVYIIHLAHNIPSGIFFAPRYFPKISTYFTSIYKIDKATTSRRHQLTQKEINENRAEKNMFYMALTLSFITIISRILIILCAVYFIIFFSYTINRITNFINLSVQTFVPTSSIFVFYFFNKMFREEFNRMGICKRLKAISNEVVVHQ